MSCLGSGPYAFFMASALKESNYSKKIKELVYYKAPKAPAADSAEIVMADVITTLFPLGWSKEGLFAYAEYSIAYEGSHNVAYTIKNMNSGDTLWRKEIAYGIVSDTAELYFEFDPAAVVLVNGTESKEQVFKYMWLLSEKEVLPGLKKEGIVFDPAVAFTKQAGYQGISFEIEQAFESEDFLSEYTLKSNKYGPRVIYKDYFGEQPEVAGLIRSPYTETLVVVCRQRRPLFEMEREIVPILVGYKLD